MVLGSELSRPYPSNTGEPALIFVWAVVAAMVDSIWGGRLWLGSKQKTIKRYHIKGWKKERDRERGKREWKGAFGAEFLIIQFRLSPRWSKCLWLASWILVSGSRNCRYLIQRPIFSARLVSSLFTAALSRDECVRGRWNHYIRFPWWMMTLMAREWAAGIFVSSR
jgi:hypothetical protein